MEVSNLVGYSFEQGKRVLEKRKLESLKMHGQFLTPPTVARYMARQLGQIKNGDSLLEPALGSGVLACAIIERLIAERQSVEISITAYETDEELCALSREVLEIASRDAEKNNIRIRWQVFQEDFILACLPDEQPSLFSSKEVRHEAFTHIISNPPYFKLNKEDKRVKAVYGKLNGHTNIYTVFMALSAKLLASKGRACFIVPRSFCSGVYFSEFRRDLLQGVRPLSMHVFQSRNNVFKGDEVLQENVIFSFEKRSHSQEYRYWAGYVHISTSQDDKSLENGIISREVSFKHFLSDQNGLILLRLPTGILDEEILEAVDKWDGSLEKYGFQVSTGRVVPFRAKGLLRDQIETNKGTVPLLWMQNIRPYEVNYPLPRLDKPQAISTNDPSLLMPNANYVLSRRFSAKEDKRRLVSAPFIGEKFNFEQIAFENHLNVIFRKKGLLSISEAIGLSALLNSAIIDRYFRIVNGNTQVNAAELRIMPIPPLEAIKNIGEKIQKVQLDSQEKIENIVFSTLWESNLLTEEFPMIQETRITMGKIEQAQEILESLGLPSAQQNEISALTLLTLAQLSEDTPWKNAKGESLRVHDILGEIKRRYGREYAENSRETIRRKVLHQFEQAGIVIRNVDDPERPTNSGLTNYVLSDLVLDVIRFYGKSKWKAKSKKFVVWEGDLRRDHPSRVQGNGIRIGHDPVPAYAHARQRDSASWLSARWRDGNWRGEVYSLQVVCTSSPGKEQHMNELNSPPTSEKTRPGKSPARISAVLTVLILVLLAIVFALLQMVALNGASERQGLTAMGLSLGCQSIVIILLAALSAWATTFLITKVEWNSILAVVVTVTIASVIGGVISFLASIIAIPVAGIG